MHHTHMHGIPPLQIVGIIIAVSLALAMYFFPTIMAIKKHSPHTTAVVIINFLFGFTLIGWIVALVLASKQPQPVVVVYTSPPPPPR